MGIEQGLGPLFDAPRLLNMAKPPPMDVVVSAIVERTRGFGYVYVAPSLRKTLPTAIRCHPKDGMWQHLQPFNRARKPVKSVAPRSTADRIMLEWFRPDSGSWDARPSREREAARLAVVRGQFAWWLVGSVPKVPRVPRAWARDWTEMLWLLAWPGSAAFACSELGLAIADEDLGVGSPDALHVQADKLQAAGDPLGLALARWCLGLGDKLAVALEVYEKAARLRSAWSSSASPR